MTEFDPDAILNNPISEDESKGQKPLTPEGVYPACTVTDVRAFEPHDESKAKGVLSRLLVSFSCPSSDVDLSRYINYKATNHPRSTWFKLCKGVFGSAEKMAGKTPRDLIGCEVNIVVFHEQMDDGKSFADYKFTSV